MRSTPFAAIAICLVTFAIGIGRGVAQPANIQSPYTTIWDVSGNRLLDSCKSNETGIFCLGYVMGVSDGIASRQLVESSTAPLSWRPVCAPKGMSAGQLRDVVVKYLDDHQEERHEAASVLALVAMRKAWPCLR